MSLLINYIKERVTTKNQNCLICIVGSPGTGKSFAGLRVNELVYPNFLINHVAFVPEEFMELINNEKMTPKGSAILFDELGVALSAREWQKLSNRLINYVLQTFRHRNLLVIFTVPDISFIDVQARKLFHFLFIMKSIDYTRCESHLKPLTIQVDSRTGKTYYKYLRNIDKDGLSLPIRDLALKMPSKELRNAYEKKKIKFTSELNKSIVDSLKKRHKKEEFYKCIRCGHKWVIKNKENPPERCPKCRFRGYMGYNAKETR